MWNNSRHGYMYSSHQYIRNVEHISYGLKEFGALCYKSHRAHQLLENVLAPFFLARLLDLYLNYGFS